MSGFLLKNTLTAQAKHSTARKLLQEHDILAPEEMNA
jgi:hypothetical protein